MNKVEEKILTQEFIEEKKRTLQEDIDKIFDQGDDAVINFFSNYVYWNGIFAGCVINLASNFHLFPTMLKLDSTTMPPKDICSFFNQKGHTVAGLIFAAAEDEYADAGSKEVRVCHKDMAWHFLTNLFEYFGKDIKTREISSFAEIINNEVMRGYNVGSKPISADLFEGLGFHIGSEKIASFEFDFLTKKMEEKYPELVSFLKSKKLVDDIDGFSWLEVHGTVEEEHFGYALQAAEEILNYFDKDKILKREPFKDMKAGFSRFSKLQNYFFRHFSKTEELAEV